MSKINLKQVAIIGLSAAFISSASNAGKLSFWDNSWTDFTNPAVDINGNLVNEDISDERRFNFVDPGYGGQKFDAE